MAITPTREQFTEFAHGTREGEVVMINLLHFAKPDAKPDVGADAGANASKASSGSGAYREYSDQVVKMVESRGGKVIWTGRPESVRHVSAPTNFSAWAVVTTVTAAPRRVSSRSRYTAL